MLPAGIGYRQVLDNLRDGVYLVDTDRTITLWNRGAERITGVTAEEVVGTKCPDCALMHVDSSGKLLCPSGCPLLLTLQDGQPREADIFLHHRDGQRVPVNVRVAPIRSPEGDVVGAAEVFSENSQRLALLDRITDLEQKTLIDPLTGLANRRFIEDRLAVCFGERARYGWSFGVLFLDIDHFKHVNDTFGHVAGDEALKLVARVLAGNLRTFDVAGRWGGEEFVVISPGMAADPIRQLAERLRMLVQESAATFGPHEVRVTISAGATLPRDNDTAKTIVQRADALMYRSKKAGRNRVHFG